MSTDNTAAEPFEAAGLRARSVRGVVWAAAPHLLRAAAIFGGYAVAGRYASPGDLGTAQLALVIFAVGTIAIELGTGPAVVQRAELTDRFLSTVFALNLAIGALMAAGLAIGATAIAGLAGGGAQLAHVLRTMSPAFALFAVSIVHRSLLARRLAFGRIAVVTIVAAIGGAAAGIVIARGGSMPDAFVTGLLVYLALATGGFWIAAGWRPSLGCDRRELPELLRFSVTASGASALGNLAPHVQSLTMAHVLGPAAVAIYALADSLARDTFRALMRVSDSVLFPALSTIQRDPARSRTYYLSAIRLELFGLGPLVVRVGVFAEDLGAVFYGERWHAAAPVAQALTIVTARTITAHTVGAVCLSQGRAGTLLLWNACAVLLAAVYVIVGARWGVEGVAWTVALAGFGGWTLTHAMANRVLGLRFSVFLASLARPAAAIALFAGCLLILKRVAVLIIPQPPLAAATVVVLSLIGYVALAAMLDRELLRGFAVSLRELPVPWRAAPAARSTA